MTQFPSPPATDLAVANIARQAARRCRTQWLLSINEELMTPIELIEHAATDKGKPLLKLSLRKVLMAQPGWGTKKSKAALDQMFAVLKMSPPEARKLTVGWLLDPRTGGRRLHAWIDAVETQNNAAPWPGFPFSARTSPLEGHELG